MRIYVRSVYQWSCWFACQYKLSSWLGWGSSLIFSVWHELLMPKTMTCKPGEVPEEIQGGVDPVGGNTGKHLNFEGNPLRYI